MEAGHDEAPREGFWSRVVRKQLQLLRDLSALAEDWPPWTRPLGLAVLYALFSLCILVLSPFWIVLAFLRGPRPEVAHQIRLEAERLWMVNPRMAMAFLRDQQRDLETQMKRTWLAVRTPFGRCNPAIVYSVAQLRYEFAYHLGDDDEAIEALDSLLEPVRKWDRTKVPESWTLMRAKAVARRDGTAAALEELMAARTPGKSQPLIDQYIAELRGSGPERAPGSGA